jgi:outer membrane protein assembly factor BamB
MSTRRFFFFAIASLAVGCTGGRNASSVTPIPAPTPLSISGSSPPSTEPSAVPFSAAGDIWPTFHHDAQRTGNNPDQSRITTANVATLALKWQQSTYGTQSNPIVYGGVVYLADNGGTIHAWDESSGALKWIFYGAGNSSMFGSPAYDAGTLYIGDRGSDSRSGIMYAIDARSGSQKWQYAITEENRAFSGSPLVANGSVYVGEAAHSEDIGTCDSDNQLLRLSESSGEPNGALTLPPFGQNGGDIWSAPAEDAQGDVYVTTGNDCSGISESPYVNSIVKLDATGSQSLGIGWSQRAISGFVDLDFGAAPVVVNDLLIAGSKDGAVYAVSQLDGNVKWSTQLGGGPAGIIGTIATDGKYIIVPVDTTGTCSTGQVCGALVALDFGGNVVWKVHTHLDDFGHAEFGSPAISNGLVYATFDGGVNALDENTGKILWSYKTGKAFKGSPTIVDGGLFVGDYDGDNFYCFTPYGK